MSKATNNPGGTRNDARNARNNQKAKYGLLVRIGGSSRNRRNKSRRELIALGHEQLAAVKAAKAKAEARKAEAKAKARAEAQARTEEQAELRAARRAEVEAERAERHARREARRQARRAARPVTLRKASHNKAAIKAAAKAAAKAVRSLTLPAPEAAQAFLQRAERVMASLKTRHDNLLLLQEIDSKKYRSSDLYTEAELSHLIKTWFEPRLRNLYGRMVSLQHLMINAQQNIEFQQSIVELGRGC